jgi:hypothetical protein
MGITYRGVKGSKLTIAEIDSNFSYLDGRISALPDSSQVSGIILADVDSAYVQARQADIYRDSGFVTGIVDTAYIQARQLTFDFMDSAEVISLIDSAYVQARQTPQDFAYASLTGTPNVLDSIDVTSIIDSAYIQAKQADIYRDSSFISAIIDSAYVQARENWLAVDTDIIPAIDSQYDLGSPTHKWKDLHLSGSTIYLGGLKLQSLNDGAEIQVLDNNDSAITLGGGLSAGQVNSRIDTILPYGQLGEFVVASVNNSNTYTTDFLVSVSDKIVDDDGALATELADTPSLADVFNTWDRFSHDTSLTFPANASEAAAWSYNAGTNTVSSTVNSGTVTGFYSPETYDDWTFETDLASAGADNDIGFVVAGFVIDPVTGYEYTLTVFRQTNGGIGGLGSWGIVYNMGQTDQQVLATNSTAQGSGGWDTVGSTRIKVVKSGRTITATTSQFGGLTLDPATELTYDLGSNANTTRFAGPVQYGFGAWSQDQCAFTNINFVPQVPELLYDFSSGNIYTYSAANQLWSIDSNRSLNDAPGRILHNFKTGRTFYNTGAGGYAIGTARQFNDVIYQLPLTAEPNEAKTGGLGLKPGMFAVANGINWDPAGKGGSVPYPVFWDGVSWNALY